MRTFLIIYTREDSDSSKVARFAEVVRESFEFSLREPLANAYIVKSELSAEEICEVTSPDLPELGETHLVFELGDSAAFGLAGADFIQKARGLFAEGY